MSKESSQPPAKKAAGIGIGVVVFAAVWLVFDNLALGIMFGLLAAIFSGARKP